MLRKVKVFEKNKTVVLTALIVLIAASLVGGFYWFQIRPERIAVACKAEAEIKTKEKLKPRYSNTLPKEAILSHPSYGDYYNDCLKGKRVDF